MPWVTWRTIKRQVCERIDEEVALEFKLVYPAELLPDQPPRIIGRRCSKAMECNQLDKPTCHWAGTLPGYDPFR
ncbi:MAG: hypothetical protein JSV37_05990 [Anaerolineaceae bacterium]|nr:MAG: hypothetical protein JSV37_05990 [Anaerolineaceae bacterium]